MSFADALKERKPLSLTNIASLSKIASFVNPDHFFIYDSRAVYSLNRILLDTDYQGGYYPIPRGRGDQYKVQELRKSIRERVTGRKAFYPSETAYYQYCDLLHMIAPSVLNDDSAPERLEMLLFVLADTI